MPLSLPSKLLTVTNLPGWLGRVSTSSVEASAYDGNYDGKGEVAWWLSVGDPSESFGSSADAAPSGPEGVDAMRPVANALSALAARTTAARKALEPATAEFLRARLCAHAIIGFAVKPEGHLSFHR